MNRFKPLDEMKEAHSKIMDIIKLKKKYWDILNRIIQIIHHMAV